jgi:hypothetical protein
MQSVVRVSRQSLALEEASKAQNQSGGSECVSDERGSSIRPALRVIISFSSNFATSTQHQVTSDDDEGGTTRTKSERYI